MQGRRREGVSSPASPFFQRETKAALPATRTFHMGSILTAFGGDLCPGRLPNGHRAPWCGSARSRRGFSWHIWEASVSVTSGCKADIRRPAL